MQFLYMSLIQSFILFLSVCSVARAQNDQIFSVNGDVNIAFLINDCQNDTSLSYSENTLTNAAIWTIERINFLELLSPLKLGLSVYKTCSEFDFLKTLFDLYQNNHNYTLGLVTLNEPSDKVKKFSGVLDIRTKVAQKYSNILVKAAVNLLKELGWRENITVVTTEENIIDLFYTHSRSARICIRECLIFEDARSITLNASGEDPLVFFGTAADINLFITNDPHLEDKHATDDIATVFVPLDGDVPTGLPVGSFLILPPHSPPINHKRNFNILPSPLLFEIAEPLLNIAISTQRFVIVNCNDTTYKVNCLKSKPTNKIKTFSHTLPSDILKSLRIDPLEEHFVYEIYKVESSKSNDTVQPIYDCVNVAAINAASVARAGVTPSAPVPSLQQPDLYSCPALPEDIDFDLRCDSPTSTDKVTRF